jgi:hypothetical protein
METVKRFFAILFLSKVVLLTPQPITITPRWTEVRLVQPISAVSPGAVLFVDVSRIPGATRDFAALDKMFPAGTIEAELIEKDGHSITLRSSGVALGDDTVEILLSDSRTPIGVEFSRLRVRSTNDLEGVQLRWQNHSK